MTTRPNTILCVDDEPDVLMVAQMCLETVGNFHVITAVNGKEALSVAEKSKPDVILLDIMMPEMDGPATLHALRQLPAFDNTPIIFMTARVRNSEVAEYLEMGANGVVAKPFDPMTLPEEITGMWEKFHSR